MEASARVEELLLLGETVNRATKIAVFSVVGGQSPEESAWAAEEYSRLVGSRQSGLKGQTNENYSDSSSDPTLEQKEKTVMDNVENGLTMQALAFSSPAIIDLTGTGRAGLGVPQQKSDQTQRPAAQQPAAQPKPPAQQPSAPPEGWQLMRNPNTGQMIYVSPDRKSYMEAQ